MHTETYIQMYIHLLLLKFKVFHRYCCCAAICVLFNAAVVNNVFDKNHNVSFKFPLV